MQNAKDTFYITLQARLAAVNPSRTIVVRGVTRPAVLVEENELPSDAVPLDAFRLRWTVLKVDPQAALPLVTMACEIRYATDGNAGNGGMDRGRLLAAMDAELAAALGAPPRSVTKTSYSTAPPTALGTNVFWGDAAFAPVAVTDERLERVATVEVFCYQEAGEL
ncbi:MAG TPA: hypothetical protein VMU57_04145 [Edaphobacter sp.]|uniref:hypothetical protein n=1 Tax=Edaphobacter sp. TaxID=1934404 RepID=UPI002C7576EE|nr:hypothetical protein [Edaphobacter sp.]HUZ94081.1 hypothetical protein [Edaphobacter sp.]